ncbi:hypothetical protein F4604DRAFT_1925521 [Suillus subluteus]|nr:hypothetical protein F4604DRAFT_1925521 [Suillus subluteus]
MVYAGGRPLASLINDNFKRLERVDNSSAHLSTTQSARRCNLSVDTFETLSKICANLGYHNTIRATEAGKSTRRRHAHMHTREEIGIAVETAQDLEAAFAWAPPLSTEPRDADVTFLLVQRVSRLTTLPLNL